MYPTSFEDYIGHPKTLQAWKQAVTQIKPGQLLYIYGYSGVGKTTGTLLLTQPFNTLLLDTANCSDGRTVMDRILKFQNWSSVLCEENSKAKIVILDELETFLKTDRNILNTLLDYLKKYAPHSLPIILLGDTETSKKLGEIRSYITETIFLHRLQETDIFLYLKKHTPKNKIKLTDLLKIAEDANGNLPLAIKNVEERLQKKRSTPPLVHYRGEEHKTFNEIFTCTNPDTISWLLLQDTWMNPLKIHENSLTILDDTTYPPFLQDYIFFERWQSANPDNHLSFDYLAHALLHHIPPDIKTTPMEFSKLLSYISTQKKFKKMHYTFEDLGRNKNIIL